MTFEAFNRMLLYTLYNYLDTGNYGFSIQARIVSYHAITVLRTPNIKAKELKKLSLLIWVTRKTSSNVNIMA